MSHYLRDILSDIPPVDKMKVVIMPDVSTLELETFLGFLFVKQEKLVSFMLTHNVFNGNNIVNVFTSLNVHLRYTKVLKLN